MDDREYEKMSLPEKVKYLNKQIDERIERWNHINKNGCNDPFWSDGVNMNLVRNHIIYYLNQLADLKREPRQTSLFDSVEIVVAENPELDPRVPPIVSSDYMARERELLIV